MFATLKKELNIVEVVSYVTETEYKLVGENTWVPEDEICPSCGHKNCFRIKHNGNNEEAFAKCFSENLCWDIVSIVAKLKEISNVDAAKLLAKHYDVKLPHDFSPLQELMNLAANYYTEVLKSAGPIAETGGLTPVEYLQQVRKLTDESIASFNIGFSDGGLVKYLESLGIAQEIIKESGLVNKKGFDFFPPKVFIYPHFVRGRVSHFTQKDPLKLKIFQLPNKHKLNSHLFYNQDSVSKSGPIAITEGELDLISLVQAGWDSGAICCNGSISGDQFEWMTINLKARDVVTFYDADPAGDTYREKTAKLARHFKSLTQLKVSGGCKDVDDYLKAGGDLQALLESAQPTEVSSIEVDGGDGDKASPVIVKDGMYQRIVYKDGEESLKTLTNFTLKLLNVYKKKNLETGTYDRYRDVVVVLPNGRTSNVVKISSDAKTSVKSFKTVMANAIDASVYCSDSELTLIWEKVIDSANDKEVELVEQIGYIAEYHGWLFKDCFIADSGAVYEPDAQGVFWLTSVSGIKPVSLDSGAFGQSQRGLPRISTRLNKEERKEITRKTLYAIAANIGDMAEALTILGWCLATANSIRVFEHFGFFPHLHFWGSAGKGKTYIIKMLLDIFAMEPTGYTGVSSLNSGVSFSRRMAFNTSLPMCIDEIRSDDVTADWYGAFRLWYNREGRTVSAKEGNGTKTSAVNCTIVFGGEDVFADPATRSRVIPIRIRQNNREMVSSFKIMESLKGDLNAIGYEWLLNFGATDVPTLKKDFDEKEAYFRTNGVEPRQARNWAAVATFAEKLKAEYCPEFNYLESVLKMAVVNQEEQQEETTLQQFWDAVESMQTMERPPVNAEMLSRNGDKLYVWFTTLFRVFEENTRSNNRQKFSKGAISTALREEPYYIKETRHPFGMSGVVRRCIQLNLENAPDTVKNIASYLDT